MDVPKNHHRAPDELTTPDEHVESDLGIAAFLMAKGHQLLGLVQIGDRYAFRFADEDGDASRAALAYIQGESIPARSLIAAEKDLKDPALFARESKTQQKWKCKNKMEHEDTITAARVIGMADIRTTNDPSPNDCAQSGKLIGGTLRSPGRLDCGPSRNGANRHLEGDPRSPYSDSLEDLIADAKENPAIQVIEKMMFLGDRILIHGWEETFKTSVVLSMAHAIATGTPWLGELQTSSSMRVGILETEMRNPGLGERLAKMYSDGPCPANLKFLSRQKLKEFRHAATMDGRLRIIREWAEYEKLNVVFVDVISDVFVGGKNPDKELDVTYLFDQLELINSVKVWVLVRHDSKPSKDGDGGNTNNRIRGSSEWKENVETVIFLSRDGRTKGVKASIGKFRYGRKPCDFTIRYDPVAGIIVPSNPLRNLLYWKPMTREELIVQCKQRFNVGESRVDQWLKEVKEHITSEFEGHEKRFSRSVGCHPELIWNFGDQEEEES